MANCSLLGCWCGIARHNTCLIIGLYILFIYTSFLECYLPQRFTMTLLATFGVILAYGQRVNVSLIITEMVMPKESRMSHDCPGNFTPSSKKDQYDWTELNQNVILASFYTGYVPFHVPGGILADKFGSRIIFSSCMLASSFLTCLSPVVVHYSPWWMFAILRGLIGVAQAAVFPPITTLMARWIPKTERATVGGVLFAALSFGVIFGNLFTGGIKNLTGSWEMVFYFWGGVGFIWYIFTMLYLYSDPDTHPNMTDKERALLEASIVKKEKNLKPDWKAILSDAGIWALIFGQLGHGWLIFFLTTNLSKYFKDVLHLDIKKNTLISSFPYLLQWFSSVASGRMGDWMIKKKGYSVTFIRKSYTTAASVFPSICLLIMPYVGCNMWIVIFLVSMSLLTMGPFYCGLKVNVIDMTTNFAGITMALVNGLGAFSGICSPYVVAALAPNNTLAQWKWVMWVLFAVASITNIIYIIWGKADRAKWDMSQDEQVEFQNKKDQEKADKIAAKEAAKQIKRADKEAKKAAKEASKAAA